MLDKIIKTVSEEVNVLMDKRRVITPVDNLTHLKAAMDWLKLAHDVTVDEGVAQTYLVKHKKWAPSYPETTGYIIPTFYRYYHMTGEMAYRERAIRMANWECDIQLENGGVLAGALGDSDKPTIFNTGQVLFGWVSAYEEEQNERYLHAAHKAASWLCDVMDDDGCWRKYGSPMTLTEGVNLYNTRSAWGVARAHKITGEQRFLDCAIKNLEWALGQCLPNGWAKHNCLQNEAQPFLHTIAYAMRGFLEIGHYAKRDDFIQQAVKMGDAVMDNIQKDGFLSGRFDRQWQSAASWSCLTGNAQISINWCRLTQLTGDSKYFEAAKKVMAFTKSTQLLHDKNINYRGGIKGSHPINGGYHPWQYPNWATKFFADALMIIETLEHGEGAYESWI